MELFVSLPKTIIMNLNRISVMEGPKHVTGFLSDRKFPPYLRLTLNLLDIELDPGAQFTGSVEFIHVLPNFTRITNRINFTQKNFDKGLSFSCNISTGDLLDKIRISLYNMPAGLLEKQLTDINPTYIDGFPRDLINPELPLEFLEAVRLLNPSNFIEWFYGELEALEAPSVKGSTEHFKKWAVTDKIIRLLGRGEIDQWYLDWCVQHLSNEYSEVKEALGIDEIVV